MTLRLRPKSDRIALDYGPTGSLESLFLYAYDTIRPHTLSPASLDLFSHAFSFAAPSVSLSVPGTLALGYGSIIDLSSTLAWAGTRLYYTNSLCDNNTVASERWMQVRREGLINFMTWYVGDNAAEMTRACARFHRVNLKSRAGILMDRVRTLYSS